MKTFAMLRHCMILFLAYTFLVPAGLGAAVIVEYDVNNANPGVSPTVAVLNADSNLIATPIASSGLTQPRTFNNSFSFDDWPNATTPTLTQYLTFTLTPTAGNQIAFTDLTIGAFNGDGVAPNHFQVRTSLDAFASPVVVQSISTDGFGHNTTHSLSSLGTTSDGVEFRIYFYEFVSGGGSAGLAGAPVFGGGNLIVEGTIFDAPLCGTCAGDLTGDGLVNGNDVACFVSQLLSGSSSCGNDACADMNGDGEVSIADVSLFSSALLNSSAMCP
jgi:Dockerin type I domain